MDITVTEVSHLTISLMLLSIACIDEVYSGYKMS